MYQGWRDRKGWVEFKLYIIDSLFISLSQILPGVLLNLRLANISKMPLLSSFGL